MNRGILILAGGKGSRMGYCQKGELLFNSSTFLDTLIENFKNEKIYISTKKEYCSDKNVNYIYDENINYTPFEAIIHTLEICSEDILFIIGCDMPFMNQEIFIKLLENLKNCNGVILFDNNNLSYPLGALYTKKLLPKLRKMKEEKNYKLQDIFKNNNCLKLSMNELKISEKYFININTPEDYEKYIKRG